MSTLVVGLPGNEDLARRLGDLVEAPAAALESRRFPDGETYLRIDADCRGRSVVVACTLAQPDDVLPRLIFLADAARDLGAARIGLVAPYLAYMRQDTRFKPGEAVTSRTFAALLSRYLDWLVTVDPHLHRYRSLAEIYSIPARVVHAAPALAEWIQRHVERPLVVGPDQESLQWVAEVATRAGAPSVVLSKTRRGDRDVDVAVPDLGAYRDRTPVVVDDIAASGRTMIQAVTALVRAGFGSPVCAVVHALFGNETEAALRAAGAAQIVSTTSVPHRTNRIDLTPLLAAAARDFTRS